MNGWRTTPYTILWGAARALHLAARASTYLAAGTLRLQDFRTAIANNWDDFFRTEGAILSGLMAWERNLYGRFLKPSDHVLLVGCGTGRDLIALLRLGYRIDGLDVSGAAIAIARRMLARERLAADLYVGPIEAVPLPGRVDAVIFSWFCYGYIPQADRRIAVLRKVAAHLKPGGRILISYNIAEPAPRLLAIRLTQLAARLTGSDWRPEIGDVFGPVGERRAVHFEHQFREGEFEYEARAAGLDVIFHERSDAGTAVLTGERSEPNQSL